jgi:uncharacterized membrane protein
MNKKFFSVVLVLICTLLTTVAQFFLKSASGSIALDFSIFTNTNLYLGGIFYGLGLILYVYALKFWELSRLAPLFSIQYIFVTIMSSILFKEQILIEQILGLFFILVGVFFIVREVKS